MRALPLALLFVACSAREAGSAQARLATDLDAQSIDVVLQVIARSGGPRGERAPQGPLRWQSDPLEAIQNQASLAAAPASAQDVPPLWRDPGGTWVAIGGRAEVLLAAADLAPLPRSYTALVEPALKGKVALVAPLAGISLAHFAALYAAWGEPRMTAWLDGLAQNEAQLYATDAEVRAAVVSGRAAVGLCASDEAAKAVASAAQVVASYPNQKSIGTFVWPSALSIAQGADPLSRQLAERLAGRDVEQLLVARVPGWLPLRPGIPVPPGVRSAANLVVMSVTPERIAAEMPQRKAALAAWAARLRKN